ncbi:MAG: hypothetical protein JO038_05985, partial [Alphaproteobacteria bacterium]|nr:hypothetical protein [Alphaproteobacteria bacterium]
MTEAGAADPLGDALRALAVASGRRQAWDAAGRALAAADRVGEAHAAFAEAVRLAPGDNGLARRLARAAVAAGQAGPELARWPPRDGKTPSAPGLLIRAHLLAHLDRLDDAVATAEQAVAAAPDCPEAAAELAELRLLRAPDAAAEAALRRALDLNPEDAALRRSLGRLLLRLYRSAAAGRELAACLDQLPSDPDLLTDMALAELRCGEQTAARRCLEQALAIDPANRIASRLLCHVLAYADGVSTDGLTAALRHCAGLWPRGSGHAFPNIPDPERRLRLGLLGGSFCRHPILWLTLRGLEGLDRGRFDIHCYAAAGEADAFTSRLREISAGWHPVGGVADAALARLIRSHRIDILIDLGGYLDKGRLPVLAQRPAPVQIKWVGAQFHTTAMPEVDWLITDRFETPPSLAPLYTEQLLVLPDSYVCYDAPEEAPAIGELPARCNGFVTFGSFNNLMKITPGAIAVWARLLRQVSESRLLIKAPQLGEKEAGRMLLA